MHRHCEYFMVPSAGYPLPSLEAHLQRLENTLTTGNPEYSTLAGARRTDEEGSKSWEVADLAQMDAELIESSIVL